MRWYFAFCRLSLSTADNKDVIGATYQANQLPLPRLAVFTPCNILRVLSFCCVAFMLTWCHQIKTVRGLVVSLLAEVKVTPHRMLPSRPYVSPPRRSSAVTVVSCSSITHVVHCKHASCHICLPSWKNMSGRSELTLHVLVSSTSCGSEREALWCNICFHA